MDYNVRLANLMSPLSSDSIGVTLETFTSLFENEGKSFKHGEKHFKSGHVESGSYAGGEIVGQVKASMGDKLYKVLVSI